METLGDIRSPSRIALPSKEGFSGTFPESKVHLNLSLSRPEQPTLYLQSNPTPRFRPEQPHLREDVPLPKPPLATPTITQPLVIPQSGQTEFFFSAELESRIIRPIQINPSGDLPRSIRAHVYVDLNGMVSQTLLDRPVENNTLAGEIRKLRFKPASSPTDGWIEIRFTEEEAF